jgi:hypothetical protein
VSFGRPPRELLAAASLLALDLVVRIVLSGPYPGSTLLLLAACGISLYSFLPRELGTPALRLAVLPALSVGSFSILLTTVSIAGVRLTELSVRLAVIALVAALGLTASLMRGREGEPLQAASRPAVHEGIAVAALVAIFGLSLASAWDVVEPFPPPGSDWAYYLLYADQVEAQHGLLAENPYATGDARSMGSYPGVGALYGSLRILDGVSSESLARGVAVVAALTPLSIFVAVAALWGTAAGLLAAAAYAVAPVRLEPMYWHGLATTLGLVLIPVVVLAVGLMYRRRRDWRTVSLLGFSLAGVAVMHSVSAGVVAVMLGLVLVADMAGGLVARRGVRSWWRNGMAKPVLSGSAVGIALGAGVIAHLRRQAADLGSPVSYRFYDSDWLDAATLEYYYSWPFLALAGASLVVVAWAHDRRRDPALAAIAALLLASILVSQLWRVHVAFEYRRVVYYTALALVMAIGIAAMALRPRWLALAGYAVVLAYVAHVSIGLRLPERLLKEPAARSATVDALEDFRLELEREGPAGRSLVLADGCLGARVPYLLRRPTMIAVEEWQAGFEKLVPEGRTARAVLQGGQAGRRLAEELGVRYVVVDPRCTPDVAAKLRGEPVFRGGELVIVELPGRA